MGPPSYVDPRAIVLISFFLPDEVQGAPELGSGSENPWSGLNVLRLAINPQLKDIRTSL